MLVIRYQVTGGKELEVFTSANYSDAMQRLIAGLGQLGPDGNPCAICGDSGHQAWECHHNPLVIMQRVQAAESKWRCYHCGEVFDDPEAARKHFGNIPTATPRCILQKCKCLDCDCNPTECIGRSQFTG